MEIITTHKNTDFDALAAVYVTSILYPQAKPLLPRSINSNVRAFLSLHKDRFSFYTPSDLDPGRTTRFIVVDTNSWSRLDGMDPLTDKPDLEIHLWDHHEGTGDIKPNWCCCEQVGATTTLLVRRLEEENREISPIEATLFLAGIYEDTGNLTFPSTTAVDARSAGFLLEQKADLNIIKNLLRPAYGPKQKEILFEMLKNVRRQKLNGHVVSFSKVDIEGHVPGLAVVVEMYQDIVNVDAAVGIFRDRKKGKCLVIGRSAVDVLDIGNIMRTLGGGGHTNAGSAMLKSINPDAVVEWISELIKGNQQASVQISDLMSYPVFAISPQTPMKEAALVLREKGCSGLPVTEGEKIVGIISRRDFKRARKSPQMKSPVKAFMTRKVVQISPGSGVTQAVRLMVKHDIGRLPVVDNGKLIGLITRSDTMRYYYDLLPNSVE